MLGHDLLQEGQAIHARHFNIDDQHIRPLLLHFFERKNGIGHGRNHLDIRLTLQRFTIDLTHDG